MRYVSVVNNMMMAEMYMCSMCMMMRAQKRSSLCFTAV